MAAMTLNLPDLPLLPRPADIGLRIGLRSGRIGSVPGVAHPGCSLVAVPPGKQAFPFHSHWHNDELFVVLDGA